jgi:molecular chaperone GrpE
VIDNFSRALKHADETNDFVALHDGLKMVHDQFLAVLKKHHVKRIEALGRPFDPNHHEAVAEVESAAHPDHTVIEVDQEGYQLHDRTIRPSRVIVSRRPSAPEAKPPTGDEPKKTE